MCLSFMSRQAIKVPSLSLLQNLVCSKASIIPRRRYLKAHSYLIAYIFFFLHIFITLSGQLDLQASRNMTSGEFYVSHSITPLSVRTKVSFPFFVSRNSLIQGIPPRLSACLKVSEAPSHLVHTEKHELILKGDRDLSSVVNAVSCLPGIHSPYFLMNKNPVFI